MPSDLVPLADGRVNRLRRPIKPKDPIDDDRIGHVVPGVRNADARTVYDRRVAQLRHALAAGDDAQLGDGLLEAKQLSLWRSRNVTDFDAFAEHVIGVDVARASELSRAAAERGGGSEAALALDAVALWVRCEASLARLMPDTRVHVTVRGGKPQLAIEMPLQPTAAVIEGLREVGGVVTGLLRFLHDPSAPERREPPAADHGEWRKPQPKREYRNDAVASLDDVGDEIDVTAQAVTADERFDLAPADDEQLTPTEEAVLTEDEGDVAPDTAAFEPESELESAALGDDEDEEEEEEEAGDEDSEESEDDDEDDEDDDEGDDDTAEFAEADDAGRVVGAAEARSAAVGEAAKSRSSLKSGDRPLKRREQPRGDDAELGGGARPDERAHDASRPRETGREVGARGPQREGGGPGFARKRDDARGPSSKWAGGPQRDDRRGSFGAQRGGSEQTRGSFGAQRGGSEQTRGSFGAQRGGSEQTRGSFGAQRGGDDRRGSFGAQRGGSEQTRGNDARGKFDPSRSPRQDGFDRTRGGDDRTQVDPNRRPPRRDAVDSRGGDDRRGSFDSSRRPPPRKGGFGQGGANNRRDDTRGPKRRDGQTSGFDPRRAGPKRDAPQRDFQQGGGNVRRDDARKGTFDPRGPKPYKPKYPAAGGGPDRKRTGRDDTRGAAPAKRKHAGGPPFKKRKRRDD